MLLLSACHLFSPVPTIDCVEGLDCADGGTDTDTGSVTEPDAPVVGWIVSLDGGTKSKARRYEPDGEMAREWTGFDGALQAAWDGESEGVFLTPDGVYRIYQDGTSELVSEGTSVTVHDLAWFSGRVLITVTESEASTLLAWTPGDQESEQLSSGSGSFGAIAVRGDRARVLYEDGEPDLYAVSSAFKATVSEGAFDSDASLLGGLAMDAQSGVYVCSPTGAIYDVADLAAGLRSPVAVYDASVSDVSACAYDAVVDAWLLAAPSIGVVRLDAASGRSETLYSAPGGYTISDISFY